MTRWVLLGGASLVVLLAVVELLALPVANRLLAGALADRCGSSDRVEVEHIGRPAAPGLLVGRVRDLEVVMEGAWCEGIRIEHARAEVPQVVLSWAPFKPAQLPPAQVQVITTEADLTEWLAARAPLGIVPVLELSPGVAAMGVAGLPARLRVELEVTDGVVRIAPAGRMPAWFAALGLDLEFELPEDVLVRSLVVGDAEVTTRLEVEVVPGGAPDEAVSGGAPDAAAPR
jgi:hypothetical protein